MSETGWYYIKHGTRHGPFSRSTLSELVSEGEISTTTLAWRHGAEDWAPLSTYEEFSAVDKKDDDVPPIPVAESIADEPDPEPAGARPDRNFFSRHWHGDYSLARAWWVNFTLLNFIVAVVATTLIAATREQPWFGLGILLVAFIIYGWQIVGVWRSSRHYVADAHASTPRKTGAWGRVAQTFVVLGVIGSAANYYPIVLDYVSVLRMGDAGVEQYYLQQTADTDLTLNGYINFQSVRELKQAFTLDPNLSAIILNSPGGLISAAFELADFIIENEIVVGAKGECVSACVFLLAAAEYSVATPNTNIVFHHPEALVELRSAEGQQNISYEITTFYERLEAYGLPPEKLAEFKANGFTPLSLGEAYEFSIVDMFWDELSGEFYDPAAVCAEIDCFATPLELGSYRATSNFVSMAYLTTGACFDDPPGGYANSISGVRSVPCDEPHDNEVYASIEVELQDYPGNDFLDDYANTECIAQFEGFVGIDYDSSTLAVFPLYPTPESWETGDRVVSCILYEMNLEKLSQSAKGSGI
ncbi:MAG: GYF domain-containing protein [Gammaproteobacteria bacterium]|jgi:hypothetical protein